MFCHIVKQSRHDTLTCLRRGVTQMSMGRIASSIIVTLMTVLGLTGFVLIGARVLERAESEIAAAQFDFVLARASEAVERSMQLGLPLTEIEQTVPVLERILLRAAAVEAADVFSVAGNTVFSTDRGAVGEPVPRPWHAAIAEAHDNTWIAEDSSRLTIGRAISNDFGQVEGWAAIIIDRDAITPPLSLFGRMLRASAGLIALCGLFAAIFVALDVLGLSRRRKRLEGAIAAGEAEAVTATDAFSRLNARAIWRTRHTAATLAAATTEMHKLDAEV